jgi:hypothetical protein
MAYSFFKKAVIRAVLDALRIPHVPLVGSYKLLFHCQLISRVEGEVEFVHTLCRDISLIRSFMMSLVPRIVAVSVQNVHSGPSDSKGNKGIMRLSAYANP